MVVSQENVNNPIALEEVAFVSLFLLKSEFNLQYLKIYLNIFNLKYICNIK